MRMFFAKHLASAALGGLALIAVARMSAQDPGTGVTVATWQGDPHRTGQNLKESSLTYSNLENESTFNFGQLCSVQLDGQIHAQPLVETNITINGTKYPYVTYVVTENGGVYAIDGTPSASGSCTILKQSNLYATGQYPTDCHFIGQLKNPCGTVAPYVGILGTPTIYMNPTTFVGTMFVIAEAQNVKPCDTCQPTAWSHWLHALDITTLQDETGYAAQQVFPPGYSQGQASFWSQQHIQRPGLLWVSPYVYIAFSMMDGNTPLPTGSIFRYDTSNWTSNPKYFATTQDGNNLGGGVWQGAAGLAYGMDKSAANGGKNYIYFNTGNGTWDGTANFGDSFVKLDPTTLTGPTDFFTPADQYYRNCTSPTYTDLDYGSGGVMLIPDTELAAWPYLAVSGDKEGGIWFVDRGSPGQNNKTLCSKTCNSPCIIPASDPQNIQGNVQTYWLGSPNQGPTVHNNAAFWESVINGADNQNYIYLSTTTTGTTQGKLTQYPLCANATADYPISNCGTPADAQDPTGTAVGFRYGVTPSVSQSPSDTTDAVVWAIWGDGSVLTKSGTPNVGKLFAFDAVTMKQLYASSGTGAVCPTTDALTVAATRYSVPTVANGFLYLGAQGPVGANGNGNAGMFYIFGPNRPTTNCP